MKFADKCTSFFLGMAGALFFFGPAACVNAQTDNGIPASKADQLKQKYSPKTGSNWRTYGDTKTGKDVSFNPKTSELWFNPVTKKLEPVIREDGSPDPRENSVTPTGKSDYRKTEKWFNPVTKAFEDVIVEVGPELKGKTPTLEYPTSLDNGLPVKTAKNWKQVVDDSTGSSWRTYENSKTGQVVSFDPRTSELWYNPVKEIWEPILREAAEKQTYIKIVARQLIYKNRPDGARHWRCFHYDTMHDNPDQCADPDGGGVWTR